VAEPHLASITTARQAALRQGLRLLALPAGLRRRGITPRIARRAVESSRRLGRHRYVVERSLAWLVGYRRLQVRYERRAEVLLGFLYLACALIWLKSLHQSKT
jgi:transposase